MWPVQTVLRDISSSVLLQACSETSGSEFKIICSSPAKWFWTFVWKIPRFTAHGFRGKTHISLEGFGSPKKFQMLYRERFYIVHRLLPTS